MAEHTKRAHAPFPPSGAERWLACPSAQRYAALLPPSSNTEFTEFGTACHELAEAILRGNITDDGAYTELAAQKAEAWATAWGKTEPITEHVLAMLGVALPYVGHVEMQTARFKDAGLVRRLEERVTIAGKDCWGSVDCSLYVPFDFLEIIDLKGGAGKCVDPENNVQLMTYAVGEAERYDWAFDRAILTIVQPRRSDGREEVLSWECSAETLRAFGKQIKLAIKRAKALDAQPIAGDHCGWCVAKALCPAQREQALACLGSDPSASKALTLPEPGVLTPEQLALVLQHRKAIEAWFKACGALALTQPPAGWKVVAGTSKRKWIDESEAHAMLVMAELDTASFYEQKLVGVTEACKLLKAAGVKELEAALFIKPPGKPTLAPEDDKRPPLDPLKCLPALDDEDADA